MMEGWQQRIQDEWEALVLKGNKLQEFLGSETFDQLDEVDQGLLLAQMGVMTSYAAILAVRIKRSVGGQNA